MSCDVPYIIGKLLKPKCLKWARIVCLNIWNTSYGQKKGWESQPEKVGNRPDLLSCKPRATYCWKALDKGYNFALDRTSIRSLFVKLWCSKVMGVLGARFRDSHSGVPWEKSHLDEGLVERCRVYYKGEGGGFPQVWAVVSLMCSCCPWLILALKVFQLCTNHLVWVACMPVWVSEACQLFLVPSWSSNTSPLPLKVFWARERAPTPSPSVILYLDSILSPLRSWECISLPFHQIIACLVVYNDPFNWHFGVMCIKHHQCEQWNFASLVSKLASIEIAPLSPNETMACNWDGVCILIVNGTWIPLISFTSWK